MSENYGPDIIDDNDPLLSMSFGIEQCWMEAALQYLDAGLSLLPLGHNKTPAINKWKQWQSVAPTGKDLDDWLHNGCLGIGVIGGAVSGHLEVIDIENREIRDKYFALLKAADPELFASLAIVNPPAGGAHLYYRCLPVHGIPTIGNNTKLAVRPATADELQRSSQKEYTLIETRGEGGYVVAPASSPRIHPLNKPYTVHQNSLSTIPTITPEQRNLMFSLAVSLTQCAPKTVARGGRVGDDFNQRATWNEILEPHGWTEDHDVNGVTHWTRPSKSHGTSATTGYGRDLLYVFSSSTEFDPCKSYNKFAAYTVLNHGGDFKAAAADLSRQGYGSKTTAVQQRTVSADTPQRRTQASGLLAVASAGEYFHYQMRPYATVPVGSHMETYPVDSTQFRRWMQSQAYRIDGKPVNNTAMAEAVDTVASWALFGRDAIGATERQVYRRTAGHDGRMYLDLGTPDWTAVEIDADGWRIVDRPPVKFVRSENMQPLPMPIQGGDVTLLRRLVNVPNDDDWALLLAWMTFAICPRGPYPILILNGEQGSAKTTTSNIIRRLLDNNRCLLKSPPRDDDALYTAAQNNWVVAFDNLSSIPMWLSDSLCRIATGAGLSKRKHYENDVEHVIEVMRPLLVNGITDLVTRPDLLDRAIMVHLPSIPDRDRKSAEEIETAFTRDAGSILGGLLAAVSAAIKSMPHVDRTCPARMADFDIFSRAAAPALGLSAPTYREAYAANRRQLASVAIEANPVAAVLIEWFNNRGCVPWKGTPEQLLTNLTLVAEDRAKDHYWPRVASMLSKSLDRLADALRREGIEVLRDRRNGKRLLTVRQGVDSGPDNDGSNERDRRQGEASTKGDGTATGSSFTEPAFSGPQSGLLSMAWDRGSDGLTGSVTAPSLGPSLGPSLPETALAGSKSGISQGCCTSSDGSDGYFLIFGDKEIKEEKATTITTPVSSSNNSNNIVSICGGPSLPSLPSLIRVFDSENPENTSDGRSDGPVTDRCGTEGTRAETWLDSLDQQATPLSDLFSHISTTL